MAVGLSLSAAIVAVSQFATVQSGQLTGNGPYDFAVFTASMLLTAYSIFAPVVAVVIVLTTRGIASRVRIGVGLLVLASAVPALRGVIDWQKSFNSWGPFLPTPGTLVYPAAIVFIALACFALWREFHPLEPNLRPQRRSRLLFFSGLGGLVVATAAGFGLAHAGAVWAARTPISFGPAFTDSNRAAFENWLTLTVQFEDLVSTVFGVWLASGMAAALIVALSGLSRRSTPGRSTALCLGVFCVFLLSYGSVISFLNMTSSDSATTEPLELVMLVGRWGLVAVVLVMVGGVRDRSTVRATARAWGGKPAESARQSG